MSPIDDLNNIFNPDRNGVSNWFNNDLKSFLKNDFLGFIKSDVLPATKDILDMGVHMFMLPLEILNNAWEAGNNLLSGNGIYILVFGCAAIGIVGLVIANKMKK